MTLFTHIHHPDLSQKMAFVSAFFCSETVTSGSITRHVYIFNGIEKLQ